MSTHSQPSTWKVCAIFAFLLAAFGFVSQMDYEDARAMECAHKGQDYDRKGDSCVCPRR